MAILRQIRIDIDEHSQWHLFINGVPQPRVNRFTLDLVPPGYDPQNNVISTYRIEKFLTSPLPDAISIQDDGADVK